MLVISSQGDETCDFGKLRKSIIFPSEIKCIKPSSEEGMSSGKALVRKISPDIVQKKNEYKIILTDEDKVPIIAIVNKTSGGQVGNDILKSFYRYLNPIQVI